MKRFSILTSSAMAAALLLAGAARAEFLDFSYSWSISPSTFPSGTGTVILVPESGGPVSSSLGGDPTMIRGASVVTSSVAGGSSPPDKFDAAYDMTLHLTDKGSGQSKDLTFSGTIAGELTGSSSTLKATFDSPFSQQATLGGHLYTVTISPSLLAVPASGPTAQINALVKVESGGQTQQPIPTATPEPSTLALSGLALSVLGVAWRRRRAASNQG